MSVFGLLGTFSNRSALLKEWNAVFRDEGLEAVMVGYPTKKQQLPERLSEMFVHDRRAYLVGDALQDALSPLLDRVKDSALESEKVNVVLNLDGILVGTYFHDTLRPCNTELFKTLLSQVSE